MNRPYGAVDVAANLKGAVPKSAVQKVMVALAEKGELTQKVYGELHNGDTPYICMLIIATPWSRKDVFLCLQSVQDKLAPKREN